MLDVVESPVSQHISKESQMADVVPISFPVLRKRKKDPENDKFLENEEPSPKRAKLNVDSTYDKAEEAELKKEERAAKKKQNELLKKQREEARLKKEAEKKKKEEEKAAKQKQRELEKQKKEEEKKKREEEKLEKQRIREEEKKKREEEKIEKQKQRELEKQKKEEEKKKREEEKLEKQRIREEEKKKKEEEKLEKELEKKKQQEEAEKKKLEQKIEKEKKDKEVLEKKKTLWFKSGFQRTESSSELEKKLESPRRETVEIKQHRGSTFYAPTLPSRVVSKEEIDSQMNKDWNHEELVEDFRNYYKNTKFPHCKRQIKCYQKEHSHLSNLKAFYFGTRPPTYQTFSKKSSLITGRKPFVKDESYFDYEVDSDEEWEEGIGEDIGADDEEDNDMEVDGEEYDEFLVPDGYLSDEEGIGRDGSSKYVDGDQIVCMKPTCIGIDFDSKILAAEFPVVPLAIKFPISSAKLKENVSKTKSVNKLIKSVPDEAIPELIKLLHNSSDGIAKIIASFKTKYPDVSKRQVELKMKELATKTGGKWQLKDQELVKIHNLDITPPENQSVPKDTPVIRELVPKIKKKIQPTLVLPK